MFRSRAVKHLLLEEIAGLPLRDGRADGSAAGADLDGARSLLDRARRRALLVVGLDWAALIVLVVARARTGATFTIGPTEEGLFSIGLLVIAVHSGFRLGQLEKLRAVGRALADLADRSTPATGPGESD